MLLTEKQPGVLPSVVMNNFCNWIVRISPHYPCIHMNSVRGKGMFESVNSIELNMVGTNIQFLIHIYIYLLILKLLNQLFIFSTNVKKLLNIRLIKVYIRIYVLMNICHLRIVPKKVCQKMKLFSGRIGLVQILHSMCAMF